MITFFTGDVKFLNLKMIKFEWVDRKEEKNKSTHGDLGGLRNVQQVPNVLFAVVTMDEVKSVDCII